MALDTAPSTTRRRSIRLYNGFQPCSCLTASVAWRSDITSKCRGLALHCCKMLANSRCTMREVQTTLTIYLGLCEDFLKTLACKSCSLQSSSHCESSSRSGTQCRKRCALLSLSVTGQELNAWQTRRQVQIGSILFVAALAVK